MFRPRKANWLAGCGGTRPITLRMSGAALYWFNPNGKQSYKISDHQVVDFFSLPDGVHAIEGLEHMGVTEGSVIRIARTQPQDHWQALSMLKLPEAPCAIAVRRDHTLLITLSHSLIAVDSGCKIDTLLPDPPSGGLFHNSSILSADERKLYIGMRQFVGEFDLVTRKLRLLIPAKVFLNKLPKEDEERIRQQYGG